MARGAVDLMFTAALQFGLGARIVTLPGLETFRVVFSTRVVLGRPGNANSNFGVARG